MTVEQILSKIKFSRTFVRKSEMTSGNEYKIVLSYNGKQATFAFHDNFENKSSFKDWIYCLVLDMNAFDYSKDVYDFANSFGYAYEDISKAHKAYNGCKANSAKMHRLFTEDELEILSRIE